MGEAVADRVIAVPLNHLEVAKPEILRAAAPATLRLRAVTSDGHDLLLAEARPAQRDSHRWKANVCF